MSSIGCGRTSKLSIGTLLAVAGCLVAGSARAQRASPSSEIGNEPSVAVIEVYLKGVEANAADYSRSVAFSMAGTG